MEWCEVTVKVHRKAPLPEPVPGKALSRADLTAKYGADSKDLDAVEKALSPFGLTVLSKNLAARTVKLAGAASKMERAFGVNFCASSTTTSSIAAASARSRFPPNYRKS
jgi:hypothetical protein